MQKKIITPIIVMILFISCGQDPEFVLSKYEETFKTDFLRHSVLVRGNFFELEIYKETKVNSYFFERENNDFKFISYSIEFDVREIPKYSSINISERDQYAAGLAESISHLFKKMNEAKVSSFTSGFYKFGIDLQINFDSQQLLYVTDTANITNPEWKNYFYQSKAIKDHWYLYKIPK